MFERIIRIYHYNPGSRNYGDMALVHSIQHSLLKTSLLLDRDWRPQIEFINLDLKSPIPINRTVVELINKTGDLLLIGGGGLVMKGDGFDSVSGWQSNISKENLDRIRIPIVVYSIGYNVFPNDLLPDIAKVNLLSMQNKSFSFSVRDAGSKAKLEELGLDGNKIQIVPDPALNCPAADINLLEIAPGDWCIGLCWAGDRYDRRFHNKHWNEVSFAKKIAETCTEFLDSFGGGKLVLIPHVSIYDMEIRHVFREYCPYFYDLSSYFPWLYPEKMAYVPIIGGIYKRMDLVLSMRGHGMIIPFGLGIPTIGVGSHQKLKFFSEQCGDPVIEDIGNGSLLSNMYSLISEEGCPTNKDREKKISDLRQEIFLYNIRIMDEIILPIYKNKGMFI